MLPVWGTPQMQGFSSRQPDWGCMSQSGRTGVGPASGLHNLLLAPPQKGGIRLIKDPDRRLPIGRRLRSLVGTLVLFLGPSVPSHRDRLCGLVPQREKEATYYE